MDTPYPKRGQFVERKFQQGSSGHYMQIGHILLEEAERHDCFGTFLNFINEEERAAWFNPPLRQN